MKRFTGAMLCALALIFTLVTASTSAIAAGISTMPAESDVISIVGVLEIMNGDNYGNLNLDNNVTRAEFIKMALCTSSMKDRVSHGSSTSLFTDMRASHWAIGYVSTAVSGGYIKGYLDGTFKPDNGVTLEEAATIMLRIMGYSELDGGKYPDTQLAKYKELEMDNRISAQRGEALTRRECMYLMYNALCAKDKNGRTYCESLGYSTDENGRIDYLALMSSKMDGPIAVVDDSYKSSLGFDLSTASIYRNNKRASADEISLYDVIYYNARIKTVWCFTDKELGIIDSVTVSGMTQSRDDYEGNAAQDGSVIVSGKSYRLGNKSVSYKLSAYGSLAPDDFVMLLLDKDGNVADVVEADVELMEKFLDDDDDRIALISSSLKGPYVVYDDSYKTALGIDLENATIYRNNKKVDSSVIQTYDVLYHNDKLNTVWCYSDKALGLVDSATVSGMTHSSDSYKGNAPQDGSIVVSGKTYKLGNKSVTYKFSAYGSLAPDDFVMLMLDRDGNIADAVKADTALMEKFLDDDEDRVALINSTLKGPYIVTDTKTLSEKLPFELSSATVYYGTDTVDSSFISTNDVYYYSEVFSSVWVYRDTATGFVTGISPSKENPTGVSVGGKSYTLEGAEIKQQFSNYGVYEKDDFVTLLLGKGGTAVLAIDGDIFDYAENNDDNVSYSDLIQASMKGPVVAYGENWENEIPFSLSEAIIYKKNSKVSYSDISEYDVIYYSTSLKSVWVYSDKATGTLEAVSPNRISPSSVTVAGNNYSLESSSASLAVSNLGSISLGETVTLLLGKNGGAVEIIKGSENADTVYGFITSFPEKEYRRANGITYTADSIEILGVDTKTYTYEHNKLAFKKGDFVSVSFVNGVATVKSAKDGMTASAISRAITLAASGAISEDALIMDVYITGDSDSLENKSVKHVKLFPARISGEKLTASDIYYAKVENGVITNLVLKDFTGDNHTYGVISSERVNGSLTEYIIVDGKRVNYNLNTVYTLGAKLYGPMKFVLKGGKYIPSFLEYRTVDKNGLGLASVTSDGKEYQLSSDVQYYLREGSSTYSLCSREAILDGNYTMKAYYDASKTNDKIRIIIAE